MDTLNPIATTIAALDRYIEFEEKAKKKGRGHWGHKGRPGKRGGSLPNKGLGAPRSELKPKVLARDTFSGEQITLINSVVEELPQEHLDIVKRIKQVKDPVPWRGSTSPAGVIELGTKPSGLSWNKGILRHEMGHAVMEGYLDTKGREAFGSIIDGVARKAGYPSRLAIHAQAHKLDKPVKGFPTRYSMSDLGETFAESYGLYVAAPVYLKQSSPDIYRYMKDSVFGGREYV